MPDKSSASLMFPYNNPHIRTLMYNSELITCYLSSLTLYIAAFSIVQSLLG